MFNKSSLNVIEKIILAFLEKSEKKINILQLSKKIGFSYPTTLKYIKSLEKKDKIKIYDFGNEKLIKIKKIHGA